MWQKNKNRQVSICKTWFLFKKIVKDKMRIVSIIIIKHFIPPVKSCSSSKPIATDCLTLTQRHSEAFFSACMRFPARFIVGRLLLSFLSTFPIRAVDIKDAWMSYYMPYISNSFLLYHNLVPSVCLYVCIYVRMLSPHNSKTTWRIFKI